MAAHKGMPEGYHSVTPHLVVRDGATAIEFYKKAFGAIEVFRMAAPDGKIAHAEIEIGDSRIMLASEHPEMGASSPEHYGGTPVSLYLYVENVDKVFEQAVAAGAKVQRPVADQFYGDRNGGVIDPFGHIWYIATHVKDLTLEEVRKASEAFFAQGAKK